MLPAVVAVAAAVVATPCLLSPAQAATAARSFSCSGNAGDAFTARTVTGLLTNDGVPQQVVVKDGAGTVGSSRTRKATRIGASGLHSGYTEWDVTGAGAAGDLYHLNSPGVLPGNGGFFDADLEILYAGGVSGSLQIQMFDCTVTGGPAGLSTPAGTRTFTCSGTAGDLTAWRSVTGQLTRQNQPLQVSVANKAGTVESTRARRATQLGASVLHAGYTEWDITGTNPNGDAYRLNAPPVLPAVGGFFDADLEILYAGGANGSLQTPMFDCRVA
jgi:hypothetical protein